MERRKRILVVDDELPNRELLEAVLTGLGHDVDMAADGAEALEKLDSSHDLVLLDVMMSGIDGFEVARRIRAGVSDFDVPICMVTALTGKEQRLMSVEAGANDFIAKPIDKTELRVRVNSLLGMKEARDAAKHWQMKLAAQNLLLRDKVAQLEKADALKDEFLGIASHDLKNPLTGILGFASIISTSIPVGAAMTEEIHDLLPRIIRNARVMHKIVIDFLDFQALEDGEIKLDCADFDLNAMAQLTVVQNEAYAKGKGIALRFDAGKSIEAVHCDAERIRQVVENLVGNAIKFSEGPGGVVVRTSTVDGHLLLEVHDCGPGLTEGDLRSVFTKYAKLSNKPTGGEKSSGLGLAICKKMIEMCGGEIGCRNNADSGATFWFTLPLRR